MEIGNKINNALAVILALTIIFFVVVFIWLGCAGTKDLPKETLTITISFFGGIATLGAAYIAASLYEDWRKPHDLNIETDYKKEILKIIRKITPLEFQYNKLISSHFLYSKHPERIIPIDIRPEDLSSFIDLINELLGLLDELFFISRDKNIENLKKHYYNYAQLYAYILRKSDYIFKNNDSGELVEFLRTQLNFEFTDSEGKSWSSSTLYAYAFVGLSQVKLRKYISESMKALKN